jgi:hypothetical protein
VLYTAMLYPSQSHVDSYLKLQWHFLSAAPDGRGVLIAFTCLNISALPLELIDILLFVEGGEDVTVVELECVLDGQKEEAEDGSGHRHLSVSSEEQARRRNVASAPIQCSSRLLSCLHLL